jgi:hypothetical protein
MDPNPPTKPKLSTAENKARTAARLRSIRLQMAIYRALDEQDITAPADVGAALGLPAAEAATLLRRKHLHEGDLAQLEAAALRLGLRV